MESNFIASQYRHTWEAATNSSSNLESRELDNVRKRKCVRECACVFACVYVSLSVAMKKKRSGLRRAAAPPSWPVTQLPVKRSSVYHRTTALRRPLRPAPPSYLLPTRCDLYPLPTVFFPLFRSTTDTWLTSRWHPQVRLSGRGPARLSPAHQWGFFFFFSFINFGGGGGLAQMKRTSLRKRHKEHNPKACRPYQLGLNSELF